MNIFAQLELTFLNSNFLFLGLGLILYLIFEQVQKY